MNNKFPIYYEEHTRELVENFIYSQFGEAGDGSIAHELTSEYVHSDVHTFSSDKFFGDNIYATCGMGAREQNSPLDEYKRVELLMMAGPDTKNDMTIINQLVHLTKFFFKHDSWVGAWHTIDCLDDFKNKFGYSAFLFLPEILGEIDVPEFSSSIKILSLVPIYENEREVLMRCDESSDELRRTIVSELAESELGILRVDSPRASLVPETEDTEPQIPSELRKAFASDIKDMLQEFIDMDDIDYEDDEEDEDD